MFKYTKGEYIMIFRTAKLFQKKENNQDDIYAIPYGKNEEYYTYIRNMLLDGFEEIPITFEIMLETIKALCITKRYSIYKIEFDAEDEELDKEIGMLVKNATTNSKHLTKLMDRLKFLSEEYSVNIKRIYIKGKYNGFNTANFFIQSNGIIGVNHECYDRILDEIKKYLSQTNK